MAVVLAAGIGVRLRAVPVDGPKGLLNVAGVTPIERSLAVLRAHEIERVVIVTGHRTKAYRRFLGASSLAVKIVHNPDYASTGSMRSLHIARDRLADDFLLLESDLLYEASAVSELLAQPHPYCVLASGSTGQGDEVYTYGTPGRLAVLSKTRLPHPPLLGEFAGISRISPELLEAMCAHYEALVADRAPFEYDDCLSAVSATRPVHVHRVDDLLWGEIDDAAQYQRAVVHLVPALRDLETHVRPP